MGSDVLLQPSTLQADNHKKRTGFGPQQASFGVYVSNAFGGMSGALNLQPRYHLRTLHLATFARLARSSI